MASRFPASPKKLRDVALVGLVAMMAGVGAAFYLNQQDDRLYGLEEVEEFLGLPSLGMVPISHGWVRFRQQKRLLGAFAESIGAARWA